MKKTLLRNYARLIAVMGVNVQKGQDVQITASLDQPEFVRILTEECYKAGARKVRVEWQYQPLTKVHAHWQKQKDLAEVTDWEKAKLQAMVDTLPARIYLTSDDPDGLKGINRKFFKASQIMAGIIKPYRDAVDNKQQWCIAAVPGEAWAKKLYPTLSKHQAVEQLWKDILLTSRADGEAFGPDPVEAWKAHNQDLRDRCGYLNSLKLDKLHYTASNGTDFTVGLMPESRFLGGSDFTLQGVEYNPNIPSEEAFTSPDRLRADGIVYSTKPLSYHGQLIENFWVKFEEGRVVDYGAEKGLDVLKFVVEMDEGSHYLGEVALVPKESPINTSGVLFYNTLFDENAACHLALGAGFNECVEGFKDMSQEELAAKGLNDSISHTDFMIGSEDLSIEGITADGKKIAIFRDGTWAF